MALRLINKLYGMERDCKELDEASRQQARKLKSQPVLQKLKAWLDKAHPQVTPQSALCKALIYLGKNWSKLIRYTQCGHLPIDHKPAERAIRPFVIGRKNWLLSDTTRGAQASALLYSLIETAKANGHEPSAWLRYVLERLPLAASVEDYEALLPWHCEIVAY